MTLKELLAQMRYLSVKSTQQLLDGRTAEARRYALQWEQLRDKIPEVVEGEKWDMDS